MFGYIKPLEAQLRVCELDTYKAVYCGLCRSLADSFGPLARLSLSYDFTFAAMLHASLQEELPALGHYRCPYNPLKRRPHLERSPSMEFARDTAVILLRGKFLDNAQDRPLPSGALWRCADWALARPAAARAADRLPEVARAAAELMRAQAEVEQNPQASVDESCHPTAAMLSAVLSAMAKNDEQHRILSRLGYMLGRFVYLCDAVDDFDDDQKSGNFNPLRANPDPDAVTAALRATAAEAAASYALLTPLHFGEILDNILYLGLPHESNRLLERRFRHA